MYNVQKIPCKNFISVKLSCKILTSINSDTGIKFICHFQEINQIPSSGYYSQFFWFNHGFNLSCTHCNMHCLNKESCLLLGLKLWLSYHIPFSLKEGSIVMAIFMLYLPPYKEKLCIKI